MFHTAVRFLYRDRRRLALSWSLVAIATIVGYDTVPDPIPFVSSELLAFVVILVAMPAVAIFAPTKRYAIEIAAFGNLVFVILGKLLPFTAFNTGAAGIPITASLFLYLVTLLMTHLALNGHWSDRLWRPRRVVSYCRGTTRLPARALWYGMVPTPGHLDEYPDPDVVSIDYTDRTKRDVRLLTWKPGQDAGEFSVHFFSLEPFKSARLRVHVISGTSDPVTEGITDISVTDLGEQRNILVRHEMAGLPLRRAIRGWIDDTLGRVVDARLGGIETAYGCDEKGCVVRRAVANTSLAPADVLNELCPAEPSRTRRSKAEMDAFTLTRDLGDVETRLKQTPTGHTQTGSMGKSWLQEG